MKLSEELVWRGFLQQTTYEDLKELDKGKITFYHGFDASADSQTIGNLAAMMLDRLFLRHGHKAILLAGGATSLIGDPGGKDSERPLQDEKVVTENVENARKEIQRVLAGHEFTLVNNLDWTKDLTVLKFFRDIGKHFSMTPLIQRDYIAQRIGEGGSGISYTEFSYTLLQGMDYLHLFDNYGVTLQLGGSDQWGNCLSGVELIRKARGKEVHVITLPLIINKSTGKKFGKSEEGAVWLNAEKTSPYKFYQFWINVDDEGVDDYLKVYTELEKDAIDRIIKQHQKNPGDRLAQKTLAYETTAIVHGVQRADSVRRVSEVLFGGREYADLESGDLTQLEGELPVLHAEYGKPLIEILTETGQAASRSEARRFLEAGAVHINGQQFSTEKTALDEHDSIHGYSLIRRGKNSMALIKIRSS